MMGHRDGTSGNASVDSENVRYYDNNYNYYYYYPRLGLLATALHERRFKPGSSLVMTCWGRVG